MPSEALHERPIFASEENQNLLPARSPVSRMAIVSLILGLISTVVLLNSDLMVLPVLAVSIGLAAYWLTSRDDALSGRTLALIGIAVAMASGVWSVTNTRLRNVHFFHAGGQFAEHYLDTLARGKVLEAFELMEEETSRQVAGASLEDYYDSLDKMARIGLDTFKKEDNVVRLMKIGTKATWRFQRGVSVGRSSNMAREVVVRMVDTSTPSAGEIDVILSRQMMSDYASWRVNSMR